MALVSGIITINSKNEFSTFKRMQVSDITDLLKLPKQLQYEIGIDQSTSCTGIYIQDTKNLVNILLELEYANKDKKDYFADIFYYNLTENFKGMHSVVAGEIYLHNGEWRFAAIGEGFNTDDIGELASRFA